MLLSFPWLMQNRESSTESLVRETRLSTGGTTMQMASRDREGPANKLENAL